MPRMAQTAILIIGLAVTSHAQTSTPPNPPSAAGTLTDATLEDPWSALEPQINNGPGQVLERKRGGERSSLISQKDNLGQYSWIRTLGALAAVVGLIVFLSWGYRAMGAGQLGLLNRARRPGLIEIVSRTSLTPRQSICLVRVGNRMILVGQTADQLRTLDVIDDGDTVARLAGQSMGQRESSSTVEFRACLDHESRDYESQAEDQMTTGPSKPSIESVRRGLQKTIRRVQRVASGA